MIICALMAILLGLAALVMAKEPLLACAQPYDWETVIDRLVAGIIAGMFAVTGLLLILVGVVSAFAGR